MPHLLLGQLFFRKRGSRRWEWEDRGNVIFLCDLDKRFDMAQLQCDGNRIVLTSRMGEATRGLD